VKRSLTLLALLASCASPKPAAPSKPAEKPTAAETPAPPDRALAAIDAAIAAHPVDRREVDWKMDLPVPPEDVAFDPATEYRAIVDTSKGRFVIRLRPDVAPYTVTSFVYLARLGFYDGLVFHRVIPGFMVQGGCPRGDGTGNPGYEFLGETDVAKLRFDRPFLVATANLGVREDGSGTDGSQFFVTTAPTPYLDGKHSIFGEVVEGKDVVKAIEKCGSESGITSETLTIARIEVEARKK
jgi:peptidyl-prolyl cis-trans isomerase B (cyclophilin B)